MTQTWSEEFHRRLASAIKGARGSRSAQWLADQTELLGHPISRAAIANYESGRKKGLDVTELMVLAAALRLPPLALLFPQLPDGRVEVLPGLTGSCWDGVAWFSGEERSPDSGGEDWPASKELQLLRAVRRRRDRLMSDSQFAELIQRLGRKITDRTVSAPARHHEVAAVREQLEAYREELTRLDKLIVDSGGVLGGQQR